MNACLDSYWVTNVSWSSRQYDSSTSKDNINYPASHSYEFLTWSTSREGWELSSESSGHEQSRDCSIEQYMDIPEEL